MKEIENLTRLLEYGTLPYNGASPATCQDALRIINLLVANTRDLVAAAEDLNRHWEVNEGDDHCGCDGGNWVCPACRLRESVRSAKLCLPTTKASEQ